MVDEFCNSRFSFREKRDIFFPDHPVVCRTCHKPRVKRLINLNDFSLHHQGLICMFGRPHGRARGGAPAAVPLAGAAIVPAGGGVPPAAVPPAAVPPAAVPPGIVPPGIVPPGIVPPAAVPPAGAAIVPAGGGAPHGGAPPGGHGPHINPLYVTINVFNNFRALVNQNMQQLQNQVNQVDQNMQQLQNQVNQLQNQVNQIDQNMQQFQQSQNQMGQNIVGILATLGNINNNIARLNQRLGIQ